MTWSIVARDPANGALGVAVTTRAFACGARCPWAESGLGALSTQSIANAMLGPRVLGLMRSGSAAAQALERALAEDRGEAIRQIHAVDAKGRAAAHTGKACVGWAGHRVGEGFSVAGNMLAGAAVVDRTFETFAAATGDLADRMLTSLDAGQAAGGDKRGKQSAVLVVYSTEDYADINLRVDDHPEPLVELRRLLGVYRRDILPFKAIYPTRANPHGLGQEEIEAMWRRAGRDLSFTRS
jgi:uncharacterized Ntn-hydrolase superfamily protein